MNEHRDSPHFTPGGYREYLSIAYPLVISNASMSLMHFVDRLFLSWAGQDEIAASLPAGILVFTFIEFFLGVSLYTNTFVAQYSGAKQYRMIASATWQGVFFAALSGVFILSFMPLGLWIIDSSGHEPSVIALEKIYFSHLFAGSIFYILNAALSSFYSGRGKTFVIMTVSIVGNCFNGVLDYGLIFGVWGMPELGIQGAAIASVCATALMTLIYFSLFLSKKNHAVYQTRNAIRWRWDIMKRLIWYGTPSGVQYFLDVTSFTVFIFLIGQLGTVELAASNIAITLNMLSFFPMVGAGIATSTIVGQYIGKRDHKTAEKSAYTALITIEIYMLILALIYFLFPETLMEMFRSGIDDPSQSFSAVVEFGKVILLYVAIYQIADGMIITFAGALRGSGDTHFAMWTAVIFAWMFFVPGTYITLHVLQWGVVSAWIWATCYLLVLGFVYLFRFRSGYWKTIEVIEFESKTVCKES